ncbi:MAG: toprim domain-containing protein [Clostridia bacterium]|nr:toprim domain-containing protein [Clostridia bacterium]
MNITQIKDQLTCVEFLKNNGIEPVRHTSSGYLYHSPFRDDVHPSLTISRDGKIWKDLSENDLNDKGYSIIDLVGRFIGTTDFKTIIAYCNNLLGGVVSYNTNNSFNHQYSRNKKKLEELGDEIGVNNIPVYNNRIINLSSFSDKEIIKYAQDRGISQETLNTFCKQITLYNKKSNQTYNAVGFPTNTKNHFEIRNTSIKLIGNTTGEKITKDITYYHNNKQSVCVFEGFFDMLSFIEMMKYKGLDINQFNYLVLNSTSLKNKALEALNFSQTIYLCLDNDEAGALATRYFTETFGKQRVKDLRYKYSNFGDLNDFWKYCYSKIEIIKNNRLIHKLVTDCDLEFDFQRINEDATSTIKKKK